MASRRAIGRKRDTSSSRAPASPPALRSNKRELGVRRSAKRLQRSLNDAVPGVSHLALLFAATVRAPLGPVTPNEAHRQNLRFVRRSGAFRGTVPAAEAPRGEGDATAGNRSGRGSRPHTLRRTALAAFVLVLLAAAPALGAFPGTNPGESVRHQHAQRPRVRPLRARRPADPVLHQRLRPADRALRLRAQRLAAQRALPQPDRPPHPAPFGAEHARRPQPARPALGRVGGPRVEVLDRRPERPGRDPRHRHPLGQGLAAQEGRAQPRRAAAPPDRREHVRPVRLQLRRGVQRRRLRERPPRLGHDRHRTTSPAPTRTSTAAT